MSSTSTINHHPCYFVIIFLALVSCPQLLQSTQVRFLPGFRGSLPFYFETGYVGVGEEEEVQLFYYFVKSESDPEEDPLIIWLTGGPGCSSATAFFYEIGPLMFRPLVLHNGSFPSLHLNPNSWTKMASIIFLDSPVGTGFSYAKTERASKSTQLQVCDQAYEFLRKWLRKHPEFISNPFYVGGDSYSGLIVPILTQVISNGNEAGVEQFINLKGYMLGNPLTFPEEGNYQIAFSHGMGLIPDELYLNLKRNCKDEYRLQYIDPENRLCLQHVLAYQECLNGINDANILESNCAFASPRPADGRRDLEESLTELHSSKLPLTASFCRFDGYKILYHWADDINVREALHIRKGSKGKWIRCNYDVPYTTTMSDVRLYHVNLSKKSYRSLIYSGDHDSIVVHQSTQAWIRSLNYSIVDQWRSWKVNGQIAGYTRTYSNKMTFATVKGGGHTAPEYKPEECYAMFKRWMSHEPL